MEHPTTPAKMLDQLNTPAFLVRKGIIVQANHAALQLQISVDSPVADLISVGSEEYCRYSGGKLCLSLQINGITHSACVTMIDDDHLFCLESDYTAAEFRAFALAAQYLRGPLANAISGTEQLLRNQAEENSDDNLTTQINRSLHQILRAVSNMSDIAQFSEINTNNMVVQDAIWVFDELLQKAAALAKHTGITLKYHVPRISTSCLLDRELLERAVYNLISNALKFAAPNSTVSAELAYRSDRLIFTIENPLNAGENFDWGNIFSRFLREPGIEDGRNGVGLGMSIVQYVAIKHGGTVLLEHADNKMRVTMTISVNQTSDNVFNSPVRLPVDYAGGFDHACVELSEVLPPSVYNGKL